MKPERRALITGIGGQDGSYLAELLLEKGYQVFGIELAPPPDSHFPNLTNCHKKITFFFGDVENKEFVRSVISSVTPLEIYHLAAATFVSFDPIAEQGTLSRNILGLHNVLAAAKEHVPLCRVFFAGSAEMFGTPPHSPQTLSTPFLPRSVYGIAKLAGYHIVRYYRNYHGMFAVSGILYNHESPRRGEQFVTQKIAKAAARIAAGLQTELILGNTASLRDWGHAADFVEGFWLQLQYPEPHDLIFATGKLNSVQDFVNLAFEQVGLRSEEFLRVSAEFFRPTEAIPLQGDPTQATELLGWTPQHSLESIVAEMVATQVARCAISPQ